MELGHYSTEEDERAAVKADHLQQSTVKPTLKPSEAGTNRSANKPLVRKRRNGSPIIRVAIILALGVGISYVPVVMHNRLVAAERTPTLPASALVMPEPNGATLFAKAAGMLQDPLDKGIRADNNWLLVPSKLDYPLVIYSQPKMIQPLHTAMVNGKQVITQEVKFTPQVDITMQVYKKIVQLNKKPLQLIEEGLNEPCELKALPKEDYLAGCTALLLDNSRLMLMENHPRTSFNFALDALRLDSRLSHNSTLRNYKNILFLNGIARSYMWTLIQKYLSAPNVYGPQKNMFSRADISHYLQVMQQYVQHRTSISEVMQDMEARNDIKLVHLLNHYFTPEALWKIQLLREGNLSLYDRFSIYSEVMNNSRQSIIDRYNGAITQSIMQLSGQYKRNAMMPLHVWQSWLQAKSMLIAARLPPPLHLNVEDHADIAFDHLIVTSLAMMLYEYDHKSYPQNLQELVPRYLPSVPADPFAARKNSPLLYATPSSSQPVNPYTERIMGEPYSIGPDGRDDGGTPYQIKETQNSFRQPGFVKLDDETKGDLVALYEVYPQ